MENCLESVYTTFTRKKLLTLDDLKTTKLKKCLGTFDLIAIGVSATLGSGIYVLTGTVAKTISGPAVVISFFIAALTSILSGLCYTEFATRVPKAGSAYTYTYLTVGELLAFITGWNLILEYAIGSAVVVRAFSSYFDSAIGNVIHNATTQAFGHIDAFGFAKQLDFLSFAIVMAFSVLLASGMKNSTILNNILTVVNIIVAVVIVVIGLFFVDGKNWDDFAPFGVQGVFAGASTCFFAFIGFDIIATTAEEARNPGKSLPLSILGTIGICFILYFAVSTVITLMVPYDKLDANTAVSYAFKQVNATWASYIVSVGAGISMLGCTLVSMFALPRLTYAMSDDGFFPRCLARVNTRTETPIVATVVAGVLTGLTAMIFNLEELVEMLSIGTLIAYSMVIVCVLKLRYQIDEIKEENVSPASRKDVEDPVNNDFPNYAHEDAAIKLQEKETRKAEREKRNRLVLFLLFFIFLDLLCLAGTVVFIQKLPHAAFYSLLSVFSFTAVFLTVFLSRQHQSQEELIFKTPFVPILPITALFVNMYLMLELRRLTWIRVVVWMSIGVIVYGVYGSRNSVASHYKRKDREDCQPLLKTETKLE